MKGSGEVNYRLFLTGYDLFMGFVGSRTKTYRILMNYISKQMINTDKNQQGRLRHQLLYAEIWGPGLLLLGHASPSALLSRPEGSGGWVFVSITEQQKGPLEMKGSEWSQSKVGPAGHRQTTDSGSLGPGPRTPSSRIYTHTSSTIPVTIFLLFYTCKMKKTSRCFFFFIVKK